MKTEEILQVILKGMVNYPEDVEVSRSTDDLGVLLDVKVNPKDMGMIIGRAGTTIGAIRTLIRAIGMHAQERINIKLFDPNPRPPRSERGTDGGY